MPVYTEMVKNKTTGKMVEKLVEGKKQYYIRTYVTDEFGNRKQITRHNKNWLGKDGYWEAQKEENKLHNQESIKNIIEKQVKENIITLTELKNKYLEFCKSRVDADTLDRKETLLNHFCIEDKTSQVNTYPNLQLSKFDKNLYDTWKIQMKNKKYNRGKNKECTYTIRYLNKAHGEICNMFDYAINNGLCKINPARQSGKIGTAKEISLSMKRQSYDTISYEEYKKLLNASSNDLKYNTYFDLSFSRGPRTGEIRAFKIKDYNYKTKELMVNHTMSKKNILKEPKTASSKAPIDLRNDIELCNKIERLINYWKSFENYNDEWFLFNGPTPISTHALENAKNKYFELAGIDYHIRLHDFRHSCASWLFSIGIPITVISKILRHANIDETMKTYTHLIKEDYIIQLNNIQKYKENN